MNSKIINPSQYKKITSVSKEKRSAKIEKKVRKGKSSNLNDIDNLFQRKDYTAKKRFFIGISLICFMALLSVVSASLFEIEENEYVAVVANTEERKINKDFDLKIGISNLNLKRNVIINELKNVSYSSILSYDEKYNITLDLAESITKDDNLSYTIKFKKDSVNEIVKSVIEGINTDSQNIYYSAISNIDKTEIVDKYTLSIKLKEENDYFIYYLDFPVVSNSDVVNRKYNYEKNSSLLSASFSKAKNADDILSSITVLNYESTSNLINDFKNGIINMFLTSDEDDMKLLSRYDYNIKKYRDGQTYFLLSNPNSELAKMSEVRKAIVYSLDRQNIAKKVSTSFAEVIDVPYIYSTINYKYDTYAIDNILSSNGWSKKNGLYTKKNEDSDEVKLKLKIVVNSSDSIRLKIGEMIADMLEENSIGVELKRLSSEELTEAVESMDYDFILSVVNITQNPDITFLYNYININEAVSEAIKKVKDSDFYTITEAVNNLENTIYNEVACIGIISKNTNVIYGKDIVGFDNISYMRIFNDISKIGK